MSNDKFHQTRKQRDPQGEAYRRAKNAEAIRRKNRGRWSENNPEKK